MTSPFEHRPDPQDGSDPDMASPAEASNTSRYEVLPLPAQIDEDWCEMVSQVYGGGERRVLLVSDTYLVEELEPTHSEAQKTYRSAFLGAPTRLEGYMSGVKLRPEWGLGGPGLQHKPYVITRGTLLEEESRQITSTPEQEVLIPLPLDLQHLILY